MDFIIGGQSHAKGASFRNLLTSEFLKPRAVGQRIKNFNMADKSSNFTEAERRRMEAINKQFVARQKQLKQMKRRNLAIFACLLTSVAGICILFISNETVLRNTLQLTFQYRKENFIKNYLIQSNGKLRLNIY